MILSSQDADRNLDALIPCSYSRTMDEGNERRSRSAAERGGNEAISYLGHTSSNPSPRFRKVNNSPFRFSSWHGRNESERRISVWKTERAAAENETAS